MAGESQQVPDSPPDPSVYVQAAIDRGDRATRDFVLGEIRVLVQRLDDIDEATKVLNETVTRTPTEIQKQVAHLKELHGEKFASVQTQFAERDERAARESRDNKIAVDAAFAAQEKLAVQQNEGNQVAIAKSEVATNKSIEKNQESAAAATAALADKVSDIQRRVDRMEAGKVGGQEAIVEKRGNNSAMIAAISFGIVVLMLLITLGIITTVKGGGSAPLIQPVYFNHYIQLRGFL